MATWMKALAVASAAVVAVFPLFSQLAVAQAVPIPAGEELDEVELAKVEGEAAPVVIAKVIKLLKMAAKAVATIGTTTTLTVQRGCEKVVEMGTNLTLKASFTATATATQHPLATRMIGSGIMSATFTAANQGSLQDVLVAGASGMLGGAVGHGVGKLPFTQQSPLLTSFTTGFFTGAGFEAIYKAIDPHQPVTLREVAWAGLGGGVGSLGTDSLLLKPKP
jgi:hypothetical protein